MSELSTEARCAIEALQQHTGSDAERARVRARLAALGVAAVASGATVTLASAAAASVTAASTPPAAIASAAGVGAAPLGGSLAVGAAPVSATLVAGGGTAAASGAGLLAKLAGVPLALKTGALVAVVASASAIGLPRTPAARAPRTAAVVEPAAPARPSARTDAARAAPVGGTREDSVALPALEPTPAPPSLPPTESANAAPPAPAREIGARERITRSLPASARVSAAAQPLSANSTLGAETALLASALRALRAGQFERARALLDDHALTFGSHALLARERERMRGELLPSLR